MKEPVDGGPRIETAGKGGDAPHPARLERPDKYWKYNPGDVDERGHWDDYLEAYQAIFDLTDRDSAPWFVIPSNRKWFARLAVCELLIDALTRLDLDWPAADFDVEAEKRRLAAAD